MVKRVLEYSLLALCFSFTIKFLFLLDLNKRVYNHSPGGCRLVKHITNGSAGMEYVEEVNGVFITSGYINAFGTVNTQGNINFYDLSSANANYEAKKLKIDGAFSRDRFAPYGITSFVSKGHVTLYVTSNYRGNSSVEVFQYSRESQLLKHRKSVRNPKFSNLMDIVATGADRFIATNLAYSQPRFLQAAELAFQTSFGSVVYFDGRRTSYLEEYFSAANGIAIDKRKGRLYVSSSIEEVIRVYELKKDTSIVKETEIQLMSSPMNIFVDAASGDLWAAMQPVLYKTFLHLRKPLTRETHCPSQVLRIRIQGDQKSWVITEPYANDGATLWGSSSVIFGKNQMLVGSLFGRLLHCDVDYPQLT